MDEDPAGRRLNSAGPGQLLWVESDLSFFEPDPPRATSESDSELIFDAPHEGRVIRLLPVGNDDLGVLSRRVP